MGTQEKCGDALSEFIAAGLFQDTEELRYSAENGAAVVAEALKSKGRAFLRVSSKGMLPWFRSDDIVFLRKTDVNEVSRGNVVVFEKSGRLFMHRVIALVDSQNGGANGARFITKGDSLVSADAPVRIEQIYGRVEFVYRNGREIGLANGWRKFFGRFLATISPASRFWLSRFLDPESDTDDVIASSCDARNPEVAHAA